MEKQSITQIPAARLLLMGAAFVVVIAGMKAATSLIVPFLMSIFLAIVCAPPLVWLHEKKVPTWLALIIVIIGIALVGLIVVAVIGNSVADFTKNLPYYQERLESQIADVTSWLSGLGVEVPTGTLREYFDIGQIMDLTASMLSSLGNVMADGFVIVLTVLFMLLEASGFRVKLKRAFGRSDGNIAGIDEFLSTVKRYMAMKTLTSLATGAIVGAFLAILGVDFPVLWGLLAFLLNYVPTIGSIIAAVPAVVLALVQLGPWTCLFTGIGYLVVNNVVGNVIEPKLMGRELGLSTLVVFLSLIFWGWVLGPVGMFLSVPLTMTVKIAMQTNESTRPIALLLGGEQVDDG